MYKLYYLHCPISNDIRYVGITKGTLIKRLWTHINRAKKDTKSHNKAWIKSLLLQDLKPVIKEIYSFDTSEEAKKGEIDEIRKLRILGVSLTNMTDGGDGLLGYVASKESRNKQSKSHKELNRKITPEHREIIKNTWKNNQFAKGTKRSEEHILKTIEAVSKPISQYSKDDKLINTFSSVTQASKITGILITCITNNLKNRTKTAGGFKWKYGRNAPII